MITGGVPSTLSFDSVKIILFVNFLKRNKKGDWRKMHGEIPPTPGDIPRVLSTFVQPQGIAQVCLKNIMGSTIHVASGQAGKPTNDLLEP